jgi:hypothetical protein
MLERKLKTALDESRLLILGAQVLFGFQFSSAFQERFKDMDEAGRGALAASLVLLLLSVTLLIAPSLDHQIQFRGESRMGALRSATFFAAWSLLPLTLGLGLSVYAVFGLIFGTAAGIAAGIALTATALLLLYGWGFAIRTHEGEAAMPEEKPTPLKTKIEQLLTEARVIIPGGQALLGFQFAAMLTKPFAELPYGAQLCHAAALAAVALAVTLLMTPAALHRVAFRGEDSAQFFRIASPTVVAATVPLAGGIAVDIGVVFWIVAESSAAAIAAAAISFATWPVFGSSIPWFGERRRGRQRPCCLELGEPALKAVAK